MYFVVIDKDLGSVEANTMFMDQMLEQAARIISPDLDMFINEQPHLTGVRIVQTLLGNIINVDPELGLTITCMWYDVPGFNGTYVVLSHPFLAEQNNEFNRAQLQKLVDEMLEARISFLMMLQTPTPIIATIISDVLQLCEFSYCEGPLFLLESEHHGQLEYLRDQAIAQLEATANGVANEE